MSIFVVVRILPWVVIGFSLNHTLKLAGDQGLPWVGGVEKSFQKWIMVREITHTETVLRIIFHTTSHG